MSWRVFHLSGHAVLSHYYPTILPVCCSIGGGVLSIFLDALPLGACYLSVTVATHAKLPSELVRCHSNHLQECEYTQSAALPIHSICMTESSHQHSLSDSWTPLPLQMESTKSRLHPPAIFNSCPHIARSDLRAHSAQDSARHYLARMCSWSAQDLSKFPCKRSSRGGRV